jgi:hypothetical protein
MIDNSTQKIPEQENYDEDVEDKSASTLNDNDTHRDTHDLIGLKQTEFEQRLNNRR